MNGHTYCERCIKEWCKVRNTCPDCAVNLAGGSSLIRVRALEALIDEMDVVCEHRTGATAPTANKKTCAPQAHLEDRLGDGCVWQGKYGELARHLKYECLCAEVTCEWDGCAYSTERRRMDWHTRKCEHREVKCAHCPVALKAHKLPRHEESCLHRPYKCTCGAIVLQGVRLVHETQECPEHAMLCEYGCGKSIKRKDMHDHGLASVSEHLAILHKQTIQLAHSVQLNQSVMRWKVELSLLKSCERANNSKIFDVNCNGIILPMQLHTKVISCKEYISVFVRNLSNEDVNLSGTEIQLLHPILSDLNISQRFNSSHVARAGKKRSVGFSEFIDVKDIRYFASDFRGERVVTFTARMKVKRVAAESRYIDI